MSRFASVIKAVATFAFMQGSANMGFAGSQEVEVVKSVQGRIMRKSQTQSGRESQSLSEDPNHQNAGNAKKGIAGQASAHIRKNPKQTRERCCFGCAALMALKESYDCCHATALTPGHGTCGVTDYFGYAGAMALFAVFAYFMWAMYSTPEDRDL